MDQLPAEVLVDIFRQLSLIDLVSLAKAHRRFHEIITSTSSLRFFTVTFDNKGKIEASKCHRGQLKVMKFLPRAHSLVLDICGINISSVLISGDVSFPDIAFILTLCPNAKQVKFENVSVWPEVIKQQQLPELNNVLLDVDKSSSCLLNLFNNSKVTALKITISSEENGIGFRGFLRTQTHLKSIYCRGRHALDLFYSFGNSFNENCVELPFRLKILVLSNVHLKSYYTDLFLPSVFHIQFLELIDITPVNFHHVLTRFIDKCTNLDELTLHNCLLQSLEPSKSITKITLRHLTTSKWITGMKRLKKLRIFGQTQISDDSLFDYDLTKLTELAELEIHSSEIKNSLQIPSVKKLKLHQVKFLPTIFITNDNKIEELEVSDCDNFTEQILHEAGIKMKKLQRINVIKGRASQATISDLKRHCRDLKSFNMRFVKLDEGV